jgi:hypothetical protein
MARTGRASGRTIAVIVAGSLVAAGAVAIGGTVWLLSRYVTSEDADAGAAASRFDAARARLAGSTPLVEYRSNGGPVVHRTPNAPRQRLSTLHVLAFSATDQELTHAAIPFAVLRIKTLGGRVSLMSLGVVGAPYESITLEDIERHGPGLMFDPTPTSNLR